MRVLGRRALATGRRWSSTEALDATWLIISWPKADAEAYSRVVGGSTGGFEALSRHFAVWVEHEVTSVVDTVGPAVVAIKHRDGRGQGSGFVFSSDGYIVTNDHVLGDAGGSDLVVSLTDDTVLQAELVGRDPPTDIGILRIPSRGRALPAVELGDSTGLKVGQLVVAIGNPLGLAHRADSCILLKGIFRTYVADLSS